MSRKDDYVKERPDPAPFLGKEWVWKWPEKVWVVRFGFLELCILDVPNPPIGYVGRAEMSGDDDADLYEKFKKSLDITRDELSNLELGEPQ